MAWFLFWAIVFAVGSCAPIGPVNLEVMQRVLRSMLTSALMLIAGAGFAEGIWAVLAFSSVSPFFAHVDFSQWRFLTPVLFFLGAGVLLWLGLASIRQYFQTEELPAFTPKSLSHIGACISGCLLVMTNPLTYTFWSGSFIWMHKQDWMIPYTFANVVLLWLIVTISTSAYLCCIGYLTHRFKTKFSVQRVALITHIFGWILLLCSAYLFYNGVVYTVGYKV